MKNIRTFRGAGLNAASMLVAVRNANNSPSRKSLPAGATWPFVSLSISDTEVTFSMPGIRKSVTKQDALKIELSKYGYVFVHTPGQANDFGFTTPKLQTVLGELRTREYLMAESCKSNLTIARLFMFSFMTFSLAVILTVTILSVLRPHGL